MVDYVEILNRVQSQYQKQVQERFEAEEGFSDKLLKQKNPRKPRFSLEVKKELKELYLKGCSVSELKTLFSEYNSIKVNEYIDELESTHKLTAKAELIHKINLYRKSTKCDCEIARKLKIDLRSLIKLVGHSFLDDVSYFAKFADTGVENYKVAEIIEYHRYGLTDKEIAGIMSISKSAIANCKSRLRQKGYDIERPEKDAADMTFFEITGMSSEDVMQFLSLIESGKDNREISQIMGVTLSTVLSCRQILPRYGVIVRKNRKVEAHKVKNLMRLLQEEESVEPLNPVCEESPADEVIEVNPNKKSSLTNQQKSLFMKMKMEGASNEEVMRELSIPAEEIAILLSQCEKLGVRFKR